MTWKWWKKPDANCNVGVGTLAATGIALQSWVRNIVCPHCRNKIGNGEYIYSNKSIWHKSCLKEDK